MSKNLRSGRQALEGTQALAVEGMLQNNCKPKKEKAMQVQYCMVPVHKLEKKKAGSRRTKNLGGIK